MKRGCFFAIFGPDGAGKTTVARLLQKECAYRKHEIRYYRWRPQSLPSMKPGFRTDNFTDPDSVVPRSWWLSFLYAIYFCLDFIISYRLEFVPFLKENGIIVHDRYFYDLVFHPRRYKSHDIKPLLRFLAYCVPKPDFIVFLKGDPAVIRSRSPQLSHAEIDRQQNLMEDLLPRYGHVITIDVTDCCAEDTFKIVFKEICKRVDGFADTPLITI